MSEISWVRILLSAEEDNLSPFDSKITCLCQCIEINNNKYIYAYIDGLVRGGRGSSALAVEMLPSCTNPRKFISVYRTCLCAMMAIQPVTLPFCHGVYVTHTSGVKNRHQFQHGTVVSLPEQTYAYMENPQPRIRAVEFSTSALCDRFICHG